MSEPTILDSAGNRLQAGDRVSDGGTGLGTVTCCEEDEGRLIVDTEWPCPGSELPLVERYVASPWDYRHEGPTPSNYCIRDLTLIPTQEDD